MSKPGFTLQQIAASPIFLIVVIAAVYLSFLTKVYYWDGIAFAQAIEDASGLNYSLIHPNHLFYNWVGYLFYRFFLLLGIHLRAVTALQILNSFLSALTAGVMFLILKSTLRSLYLSTCLTVLFAFSATWWRFSTDADAYIVSVLFLVISFYLILPGTKPKPFRVAITFVASILFHELAVFFGAVVLLALIFQCDNSKQRLVAILKFSLTAALLACLIYFSCFYYATGKSSLGDFLRWVTYHSPDGTFSFDPLANLKYTLRGHVRLFFGGRINLLNGLLSPAIVTLIIVLTFAVVAFFYFLLKGLRTTRIQWFHPTRWPAAGRELLLLLVSWNLIYIVFLFFWIPQNTFYRLFYLPALILLAGLLISSWPHSTSTRPTYTLASFVTVLALSNFLFFIFPSAHTDKYPPLSFALHLSKEWPAGTVVFYSAENSDESLVKYFNRNTVWKRVDLESPKVLDGELKSIYAEGSSVWLETTALDKLASTSKGAAWLEEHAVANSLREVRDPAYRIRFLQIAPTELPER